MNNLTTTLTLIRQHKWLILFGCLAALIYELLNFNWLIATFTKISITDFIFELAFWASANPEMNNYARVLIAQSVLFGGLILMGLLHTFGKAFLIEAVEQYRLYNLVIWGKTTRHTLTQLHKLIAIDLQCLVIWLISTLPFIFSAAFAQDIINAETSTFLSPLIIALPSAFGLSLRQLLFSLPSPFAVVFLLLLLLAIFLLTYRQFIFHEIVLHEVTIWQAMNNAWQLLRQNGKNILHFLLVIAVGHVIAYALISVLNSPALIIGAFLNNDLVQSVVNFLGFVIQWAALGSFYLLSSIVWTNKYLQLHLSSTFIKSHDPE